MLLNEYWLRNWPDAPPRRGWAHWAIYMARIRIKRNDSPCLPW
jgi:hypothetical protein